MTFDALVLASIRRKIEAVCCVQVGAIFFAVITQLTNCSSVRVVAGQIESRYARVWVCQKVG